MDRRGQHFPAASPKSWMSRFYATCWRQTTNGKWPETDLERNGPEAGRRVLCKAGFAFPGEAGCQKGHCSKVRQVFTDSKAGSCLKIEAGCCMPRSRWLPKNGAGFR